MDKADAALRAAEHALAIAQKALKLVEQVSVIKGEKGDPGDKGDKGDKGDAGEKGETGSLLETFEGVWSENKTYERNSIVQYSGSIFAAMEKTSARPEDGAKWRLLVKRGRDGKNGAPGRDGKPGPRGPMGSYKGVEE